MGTYSNNTYIRQIKTETSYLDWRLNNNIKKNIQNDATRQMLL